MGRINEVAAESVIEVLEEICEMIESGDYTLQDIYDECQKKISEYEDI